MKRKQFQMKHIPTLELLRAAYPPYSGIRWFKDARFSHYPEKVLERKLEKLVMHGWLEYGVSINGAWMTPEGEKEFVRLLALEKENERRASESSG